MMIVISLVLSNSFDFIYEIYADLSNRCGKCIIFSEILTFLSYAHIIGIGHVFHAVPRKLIFM